MKIYIHADSGLNSGQFSKLANQLKSKLVGKFFNWGDKETLAEIATRAYEIYLENLEQQQLDTDNIQEVTLDVGEALNEALEEFEDDIDTYPSSDQQNEIIEVIIKQLRIDDVIDA